MALTAPLAAAHATNARRCAGWPAEKQPPAGAPLCEMDRTDPRWRQRTPRCRATGGAMRCLGYHRGQWRCADCRHHQLHQHQQPQRDAGRRFAGQEGGGSTGLKVKPHIKTSLRPARASSPNTSPNRPAAVPGKAGFALAGYGCTTCIGNAGDLAPEINDGHHPQRPGLCAGAVGNRNFEARIHPNLKANFPGQPAAGGGLRHRRHGVERPDDRARRPGRGGISTWATSGPPATKCRPVMKFAMNGKAFRENYAKVASDPGKLWQRSKGRERERPTPGPPAPPSPSRPFAGLLKMAAGAYAEKRCGPKDQKIPSVLGARDHGAVWRLHHHRPHLAAGSIKETSPAGRWLLQHGVQRLTSTATARGAATTI